MTKHKRRKRHGERTGTPHRPRLSRVLAAAAIVAVAAALVIFAWRRDRGPATVTAPVTTTAAPPQLPADPGGAGRGATRR